MGHERIGLLPRTQHWCKIVEQIANYEYDNSNISTIMNNTLKNVSKQFREMSSDKGLFATYKFLVVIAAIQKNSSDPSLDLSQLNININNNSTALSSSRELYKWLLSTSFSGSLEYTEIARQAATDAITKFFRDNADDNLVLFDGEYSQINIWKKVGTGAGFCEISRCFFAKYTERYIKYFLEREASNVIKTISDREVFSRHIENHIEIISKHAFDTSKITQSFAAGWFNKYSNNQIPSDLAIRYLIKRSLEKIREELRREGVQA